MGNCIGQSKSIDHLYCRKCLYMPWNHKSADHSFQPCGSWYPWRRWPTWMDRDVWSSKTTHPSKFLTAHLFEQLPKKYRTLVNSNATIIVVSNGNWNFTLYSGNTHVASGYYLWGSGRCHITDLQPLGKIQSYPPELLEDVQYTI